jgi:hypothetical protein
MIRFPCPSCKTEFNLDNSLGGRAAQCPWCGHSLVIPQPYAEGTVTDETRDPKFVRNAVTSAPPREIEAEEPSDEWRRDHSDHDEDLERRIPDIRLPSYRNQPPPSADLTPGDWVLCTLCAGIGCIVGLFRVMNGHPSGGKMMAISIVFIIIWNVIRLLLEGALSPRHGF